MPPTHPYLKGLAETRARADEEQLRTAEQLTRATNDLATLQKRIKHHRASLKAVIVSLSSRTESAKNTREACDRLILKFDSRQDPTEIAPINGWQGRYGERGAFSKMLLTIIQDAYPECICTQAVSEILQARFELVFETKRDLAHWKRCSLRNRLRGLTQAGIIERLHDPKAKVGRRGQWRAIPPATQQKSLAHLATEAGLELVCASPDDFVLALDDDEEDDLPR